MKSLISGKCWPMALEPSASSIRMASWRLALSPCAGTHEATFSRLCLLKTVMSSFAIAGGAEKFGPKTVTTVVTGTVGEACCARTGALNVVVAAKIRAAAAGRLSFLILYLLYGYIYKMRRAPFLFL